MQLTNLHNYLQLYYCKLTNAHSLLTTSWLFFFNKVYCARTLHMQDLAFEISLLLEKVMIIVQGI